MRIVPAAIYAYFNWDDRPALDSWAIPVATDIAFALALLGIGLAFACGIGFTMSLFIDGLAFEHGSGGYFGSDRLGILVGSILSAVAAYTVLNINLQKCH